MAEPFFFHFQPPDLFTENFNKIQLRSLGLMGSLCSLRRVTVYCNDYDHSVTSFPIRERSHRVLHMNCHQFSSIVHFSA